MADQELAGQAAPPAEVDAELLTRLRQDDETAFEELVRAYTRHGLRPPVDHSVPFSDAPKAILALDRGNHVGKIGISVVEGG